MSTNTGNIRNRDRLRGCRQRLRLRRQDRQRRRLKGLRYLWRKRHPPPVRRLPKRRPPHHRRHRLIMPQPPPAHQSRHRPRRGRKDKPPRRQLHLQENHLRKPRPPRHQPKPHHIHLLCPRAAVPNRKPEPSNPPKERKIPRRSHTRHSAIPLRSVTTNFHAGASSSSIITIG